MPLLDLGSTTFLLGSGVSIPSGLPSTDTITERLMAADWLRDKEQSRSEAPLLSPFVGYDYPLRTEATMGLIRILGSYAEQHMTLHGQGRPNYEHLYYLARQLQDSLLGDYENPALLPLLFELRTKTGLMLENLNALYGRNDVTAKKEEISLHVLLSRCVEFIEEAVVGQLPRPQEIRGLDLLDEILSKDSAIPLRVITLNHDMVLDTHLTAHQPTDGFVKYSSDAQRFDPMAFDAPNNSRVWLLKPHGSVNWFSYRHRKAELALKITSNDPAHAHADSLHNIGSAPAGFPSRTAR